MADPRFKNLEFKVGLFILAAIFIIIATGVLVGINKKVFTKKIHVFVKAPSGDGIKKGMPVLFSGFQIARVDSVDLKDTGEVIMKINIPEDYVKWVREDSVAKLVAQNFIGSSSVVFEGGTGQQVKDGYEFLLKKDKGLDEIIEKAKPVMDDLKIIVENIRVITDRVADEKGSFNTFMKGLESLGSDLVNKEGSLGYLLRSDYLKNETVKLLDNVYNLQLKIDKIADNTIKTTNSVNRKIDEVDVNGINTLVGVSKKLIENINNSVSEIDPILANVNKITSDIGEATDNISKIRNEADYILSNTNDLILNLKGKWPFDSKNEEEVRKLKLP
ncbi:MAG: phospholipid/cholesterol/gamma-HCH transport system substrate-binding protein [Deferribacteres bacterium]|nr:Mammalian cell entry related domain protein [Deferribacteraceae bacterium]MDK2792791.1 phospholipid/cholesterol/gamma-HCH transport system substrate-binding protein [Deferribacteres bacterium]